MPVFHRMRKLLEKPMPRSVYLQDQPYGWAHIKRWADTVRCRMSDVDNAFVASVRHESESIERVKRESVRHDLFGSTAQLATT
jgi:hypothetical protein